MTFYMLVRCEKPEIIRVLKSSYDYDRDDVVYPRKWEDEFPKGGNDNKWRVHARLESESELVDYKIRERIAAFNKSEFGYSGTVGD